MRGGEWRIQCARSVPEALGIGRGWAHPRGSFTSDGAATTYGSHYHYQQAEFGQIIGVGRRGECGVWSGYGEGGGWSGMKRGRAGGDCAARGVSEESGGGRVISAPTASERLRPLCCTARRACWCSWWRWHPGSGCRSWRGPALEGRVGCVRVCWVGGCVGELGCPPPSVPSPPPNSPPHTRCQLTLLAAGGAAGVPLCCCAAVATRSPKYPSTHKHDQRRPGSGDQGMPRPSAHGPPPAPAAPPAPPARPTDQRPPHRTLTTLPSRYSPGWLLGSSIQPAVATL